MRIAIVAKTYMRGERVCVGGAETESGELIRLLPPGGGNWPQNVAFQIGEVWEADVSRVRQLQPPHVENHIVRNQQRVGHQGDLRGWILNQCNIWRGDRNSIFDGCLSYWASGKGFVEAGPRIPAHSVGFWILPFDIECHDATYFRVRNGLLPNARRFAVKYVGLANPMSRLSAGTLVRLSLARWFAFPDDPMTQRCWLQLSGWYE